MGGSGFDSLNLHVRTRLQEGERERPNQSTDAMSPPALHSLLLVFLLTSAASYSAAGDELTVYEVLEEYDFPVGLLPKGVTGYELNNSTGKFKVYLNSTCTFSIDSYKLKYKSTITGVISTDKIKSLKGISVYVVLFWLSIEEVIRDGDEIEFSVGIASASFPVDNFSECPECGCGFDCLNGGGERSKSKLDLKRLVSSFLE